MLGYKPGTNSRGAYLAHQSGPATPQPLPVIGSSWLAYPTRYPELLQPSRGLCCSSLYNPTILDTIILCTFGIFWLTWLPSVPSSATPHLPRWQISVWLYPLRGSCLCLCSPTYELSPPQYLGAVMFPYLFLLFLFVSIYLKLYTSGKQMLKWNYKRLGRMLVASPKKQFQPLPRKESQMITSWPHVTNKLYNISSEKSLKKSHSTHNN